MTLIGELVDCGFLRLDDLPGALPHYWITGEFDWLDRYRLFRRAHNAWLLRKDATATNSYHLPSHLDDDDDAAVPEPPAAFDVTALRAAFGEGAARSAERYASKVVRRFDKFQSRLLERVIAGERFEGDTRDGLLEHIARVTKIGRGMVERLVQSEAKALCLVTGDDDRHYLVINPNLAWNDLASHPRTRAVCEHLLGAAPTNPPRRADETAAS